MRKTLQLIVLLLAVGAVGVVIGRSIAPPTPEPTRAKIEADLGLDRIVPEVNFRATPFDEAVDFVRQKTSGNVIVHSNVLETAGIDQKTPITLRLAQLPARRVLELICEQAGGGATVVVSARTSDGTIDISTADDNAHFSETRLYDVQDIVRAHYAFLQRLRWQPATQPNNASGAQSLFANSTGGPTPTPPYDEAIDEITHMITDFVAPDMWRDAGGSVGTIRAFDGRLMITATPDMHDQIAKLFELLRKEK